MSDYFVNRDDEISRGLRFITDPAALIVISGEKKIGKTFLSRHLVKTFQSNLLKHQDADLLYIPFSEKSCSFHDFRRQIALNLDDPSLLQGGMGDFCQRLEKSLAYQPPRPTIITLDDFSFERYERLDRSADADYFLEFFQREFNNLRIIITTKDFIASRKKYPLRAINIGLLEFPEEKYLTTLIEHTLERKAIEVSNEVLTRLVASIQEHVGRNPGIVVELLHHCETPDRVAAWIGENAQDSVFDFHALYRNDWDSLDAETQEFLHWINSLGGRISDTLLNILIGANTRESPSEISSSLAAGFLRRDSHQGVSYYVLGKTFMSFLSERSWLGVDHRKAQSCELLVDYLVQDWENTQLLKYDYTIVEELYSWALSHLDVNFCVKFYNVILDPMFSLGLFSERIELGKRFLDRGMPEKAEQSLGPLYNSIVSTCALIGEFDNARTFLDMFKVYSENRPDCKNIYYRSSGYLDYRKGNVPSAIADAQRSEIEASEVGDKHTEIDALCLLVSGHLYLGELSAAKEQAQKLLDRVDSLPWKRGRAYPLRDLAEIAIIERDFGKASKFAQEAVDIATSYRDIRQLIRVRLTQSRLQLFSGNGRLILSELEEIVRLTQRYRLTGEELEAKATLDRARRTPNFFWSVYYSKVRPTSRFSNATLAGD